MILGLNPYLTFDGNAQEAVKFYEAALDAKVMSVQTFADMPANPGMSIPDEAKNRVLHAQLKVGDTDLLISDTFPGPHQTPYRIGSQVTVAITVGSVEKSKEVFEKLRDGGQVVMPLNETFWSPSYGQVSDKFGVTWHISTEVAD